MNVINLTKYVDYFCIPMTIIIDSVSPLQYNLHIMLIMCTCMLYCDCMWCNNCISIMTGVTLSLESTTLSLGEGSTAEVCITASGSIPDSYSIDFSVLSYNVTAQAAIGE